MIPFVASGDIRDSGYALGRGRTDRLPRAADHAKSQCHKERGDPGVAPAPAYGQLDFGSTPGQDGAALLEPLKVCRKGLGSDVTLARLFFQAFQADRLEVARYTGPLASKGHDVGGNDQLESFNGRLAEERRLSRQGLVEDRARA